MEEIIQLKYIISALIFSGLGLIVLIIAFLILDQLTPGDLWKEIFLEKNLPVAIVVGAITLAIAHIIAAAIHS